MRLLALVLAVAGCESAPDAPTYLRDVRPILEANCVRCHGAVSRGGAPDAFRLDVFSDLNTDDGRQRLGAGLVSGFIAARTGARTMPPTAPLSDRQIEILERWAVFGDFPAEEGDPDPGDRLPELERLDLRTDGDGVVSLEYRISDPDFEIVTARLRANPVGAGASFEISRELYSGRAVARWDSGVVDEGNYVLSVRLDDGQRSRDVEIGEIAVIHPGGNRAPAPEICNVRRTQIIDDTFDLEVAVADDDVPLSIDLFAVRDDELLELGSRLVGVSSCDAPEVFRLGNISTLTPGIEYRLLLVATDAGGRSREVRSLPFIAGRADAVPSFGADVAPIFERRCAGCHGGGLAPVGGIFTIAANAADLSNKIYRRVILERTMPPRSAELVVDGFEPMTQAERDTVADWLLAGAPDN